MDLFLPIRDYDFCKGNGTDVVNLLEYAVTAKIPTRLVITDSLSEILNIAISVKNYKYHYDTVGNIRATADCVEYVFVNNSSVQNTVKNTLSFANTSVSYNGSIASVKLANVEGRSLVRVRDVFELMGKEVGWNAEKKKVIVDGDTLDVHTEVHDGNAYCYIRDIAVISGLEIKYNAEDKSISLRGGD